MGWFLCVGKPKTLEKSKEDPIASSPSINKSPPENLKVDLHLDLKPDPSFEVKENLLDEKKEVKTEAEHIAAQTFSYKELAAATKNFKSDCLLGEGGFGRVYKGKLESINQVVAIKQLDQNGLQGNREFLVEVLMLSLLHHQNLVNLIGYCADGEQRLLVYEYMSLGSLEDHLLDLPSNRNRLDWNTRMKIAAGAAKGLEYLHDKANPPVIYRDLKCSNILLGDGFHPKLSDFGLAKLGPVGDNTHVSTRVMGTYGYCAPEYAMTGQLTLKSDVYSFGVVLLELITGRKAIDNTKPPGEYNLVAWARPLFKDRRKFSLMADPMLQGQYPNRGLYQALAVAAMCIQEQPALRPLIADVVTALTYLASQKNNTSESPNSSRLAAKTVGRFLNENLNVAYWNDILESELWSLDQKEGDIMPALLLSYQELPDYLKPCFAFFSLFPKGDIFSRDELIRMWGAHSWIKDEEKKSMEDVGKNYWNELLSRCMIESHKQKIIVAKKNSV